MRLRRSSVFLLVFFSLLFCFLLLSACRTTAPQTETGSATPVRGGKMVMAERSMPTTFNFVMAKNVATINVSFFLMSARLVELDHDTQKFVPGLAESWQAGEDGRTISLRLREGLKFSDGAPLTTDDVLFTLKLLYDEKLGSVFRDALLIGGKMITATRKDERNLELVFPARVASPEESLNVIGVLPRHKLEAAFTRGAFADAWNLTTPVSEFAVSGPFTLKEFVTDQRTVLARNPQYWKKDAGGIQLPYLDEIVIENVSGADTQILKLQQGELDLLDGIRAADYATMKDQPGAVNLRDVGPWLQPDVMWFNLSEGKDASGKTLVEPMRLAWFRDVRFRQAIAHAIDRAAMITNIQRGLGTPLDGLVSPGNKRWINTALPHYSYDLNKSRALLQEAGFKFSDANGAPQLQDQAGHPVEFTLAVGSTVTVRKQMATMIQEDLAKLGIKVNVAAVEDKVFEETILKPLPYEAAIHGISPSTPDPSTYNGVFKTGGSLRYPFLGQKKALYPWEAEVDKLMTEIEVETNEAARREKFATVQRIAAEQLPIIPLIARHFVSGAKKTLGNHRPSFMLPRSLWNADELYQKGGAR